MARPPAASGSPSKIDLQDGHLQLDEEDSPDGPLSLGGALAQFPGAVLIAGHNGIVLRANDLAEPIGQVLQAGHNEDLRAAIQAALGGSVAQVSPLVVTTGDPQAPRERAFDAVVLPWSDGTAVLLGRDVTLERSLRAALIESRQRYKDLVEISNDFAWETDAEGRFVFVSPRGALGYAATDLVGQMARDLLLNSDGAETSPFTARTVVEDAEMWVRSAAGSNLCLLSTAQPLTSENGVWIGARGVCRDITTLRCHEADLAEARHRERLFSYIVNMVRRELDPARMLGATAEALVPALALSGVSIHAFIGGALGQALAQSGKPADSGHLATLAARLSDHKQVVEIDDAAGQLLLRATHYRDGTNGLLCARRALGEEAWTAEDSRLLDNIAGQVGLAIEQLARQTEMEVLSMTDPLTGLNNRRGFVESLEERFAGKAQNVGPGALFYIDLDNFKQVNDTHGHQAGDEALLDVAALLKDQIRGADLAARLGGDEFALFLSGIDRTGAERKGELLLQVAERLRGYSGDNDHPLGMSIGIAVYDPRTGETLDSLFARGDDAMYAAKRNGKHGLVIAEAHDRRGGQG